MKKIICSLDKLLKMYFMEWKWKEGIHLSFFLENTATHCFGKNKE